MHDLVRVSIAWLQFHPDDSLAQLLYHSGCARLRGDAFVPQWTDSELEKVITKACKMLSLDPESLPKLDADSPD